MKLFGPVPKLMPASSVPVLSSRAIRARFSPFTVEKSPPIRIFASLSSATVRTELSALAAKLMSAEPSASKRPTRKWEASPPTEVKSPTMTTRPLGSTAKLRTRALAPEFGSLGLTKPVESKEPSVRRRATRFWLMPS